MSVPTLDEFVGTVKNLLESPDWITETRLRNMLQRLPIEDQVPYMVASLDELYKNKTLNYKRLNELLDIFKTRLKSMSKSGLAYMPLNNKLNWIGARTVRNFLSPNSKPPYNKMVSEDIKKFKTLYQQLNSKTVDPTAPQSIQFLQQYLAIEPFAKSILSALGDKDMDQVQYLLNKIPLKDIELFIKSLVALAIENNRNEKELAIVLSNFLNTVRMQSGHANNVHEVLANLARNLEVKDPTSIVNPNLQRLVRHVSAKNHKQRLKNTKTQRNKNAWQKQENNFQRWRERSAFYKPTPRDPYYVPYNISGWHTSKRKTRRRRN